MTLRVKESTCQWFKLNINKHLTAEYTTVSHLKYNLSTLSRESKILNLINDNGSTIVDSLEKTVVNTIKWHS